MLPRPLNCSSSYNSSSGSSSDVGVRSTSRRFLIHHQLEIRLEAANPEASAKPGSSSVCASASRCICKHAAGSSSCMLGTLTGALQAAACNPRVGLFACLLSSVHLLTSLLLLLCQELLVLGPTATSGLCAATDGQCPAEGQWTAAH
jgi:hypothetical protein